MWRSPHVEALHNKSMKMRMQSFVQGTCCLAAWPHPTGHPKKVQSNYVKLLGADGEMAWWPSVRVALCRPQK